MAKIFKRTTLFLALGCSMVMGMNSANAAIISSVTTQTADLVFSSPSTASVTLTPEKNLVAGSLKAGQLVATGTVSASATTDTIAYRWTPGTGTTSSSANNLNDIIQVTGTNNKSNTLTLKLAPSNQTAVAISSDKQWIVPTTAVSSIPLNITLNSDSVVAADTYTISVDAAVWGN